MMDNWLLYNKIGNFVSQMTILTQQNLNEKELSTKSADERMIQEKKQNGFVR